MNILVLDDDGPMPCRLAYLRKHLPNETIHHVEDVYAFQSWLRLNSAPDLMVLDHDLGAKQNGMDAVNFLEACVRDRDPGCDIGILRHLVTGEPTKPVTADIVKVPVLVWSNNTRQGLAMANILERAGFTAAYYGFDHRENTIEMVKALLHKD